MTMQSNLASYFPAPLIRILVAAVVIAIVCYFVSGLHDKPASAESMTPEAIAARLQPVAHVMLAEAAASGAPSGGPSGASALMGGKAVYSATCSGCHGEGVAGAPKVGDKKAWAPRIAQGFDTLVKHAIDGFTGKAGTMPPNGGGTYEPVEMARAVAYMADQSGASFREPTTFPKK